MTPALLTYKEKVKRLSIRLIEMQRPIRVLDAIKWPAHVLQEFKKSKYKDIPSLGPEDYRSSELGYHPEAKKQELADFVRDVRAALGDGDSLGSLLQKIGNQYIRVIEMLEARGTPGFWNISRELYGSPQDTFFDGKTTISDLGRTMYPIFSKIQTAQLAEPDPDILSAEKVVEILNHRFEKYFGDEGVRAKLSDGIIADAAAGGDTVKIRSDSTFTHQEVNLLEVHEGWVHVATTMNGNAQHVAQFLAKGPPRVAATQEGLAVIMEIFTFRSFPRRAKHINDRLLAIEKVEDGCNLIELMEFFRTEGYTEEESLFGAIRVLRGGTLTGGAPFTKDISYCKGFIQNYNFMRAAIRAGRPHLLPFLFAGKVDLDDIPMLYQKYKEGVVDAPRFLPPQFRDLNGLVVWMSFSNFLNQVSLDSVHRHYDKLFNEHL